MPYTYMPFLLCGLTDKEVDSYIVEVPKKTARDQGPDWEMFVGEVYRLPLATTDLFTWSSSDETVAFIDEKGMLAGKSAGDVLLTLSSPGGKQFVIKVRVSEV